MKMTAKKTGAVVRGFTLLEMLVYMAVFVVVVGCASMTYFECFHSAKSIRDNADDVDRALEVGERWRADMRGATGPVRIEKSRGAEECRVPDGTNMVIYTFANGEIRRQLNPGSPHELWLSNVKSSQMQSEARGPVAAWRWELELKTRRRDAQLRPLFTFECCAPGKETAP